MDRTAYSSPGSPPVFLFPPTFPEAWLRPIEPPYLYPISPPTLSPPLLPVTFPVA